MKITIIIMTAFLMQVSASTKGQITLSETKVPLESILKHLKNQSGYYFFYNGHDLKKARPVTLNVKNASLEQVLELVMKGQPLSYQIDEKTVVIKEKKLSLLDKIRNSFQAIEVKGGVTDRNKKPLVGATVSAPGHKPVLTGSNGTFELTGVAEGTVITISYIGYVTKTLAVKPGFMWIELEASESKLDEVQVMAYGTTSKRVSTGNITKISGETINNTPVANPMLALQGRVPGMIVTQSSGVPGSPVNMQIRGRTRIDAAGASEMPLFVVDGVPMASEGTALTQLLSAMSTNSQSQNGLSPFSTISNGDIESIEILKDADATAIYGSRGASGVVLITTKKGKAGLTSITARFDAGFSKAQIPDLLNTQQYVAMRKEAFKNDNIAMTNTNAYDLLIWDTTRTTNLAKELIGGTAGYTNAQLGISGGSNLLQYAVRGTYTRESNVYQKSMPNARATVYFNMTGKAFRDRFSFSFTGSYADNTNKTVVSDMATYLSRPPHLKLYNDDGSLAWNEGGVRAPNMDNPLAVLEKTYVAKTGNLTGSMVLGYQIIPDLSVKATLGYNKINGTEVRNVPKKSANPLDVATSQSQFGNSSFQNFNFDPYAEYKKTIGKGKLVLLVGGNLQKQERNRMAFTVNNYASDALLGTLNGVAASGFMNPSSEEGAYKYAAVFGRATYNYDNTYILNVSGNRDGSSRFGPSYKFSTFGAVGASWIFSNLDALKNSETISFGKLRASYGTTGNDKIGDYLYMPLYSGTILSSIYRDSLALAPQTFFKPDLHWEMNKKLEIATELGFLKNRIFLDVAWYRNNSTDPLVAYPLPGMTGFQTVTANLKDVVVQNRGWELVLSTENIKAKQFNWKTSLNVTFPQNRLLKYPGLAESSYAKTYVVGKSLDVKFLSNFLGVDPATGLYKVQDLNNSGSYEFLNNEDLLPQFDTEPEFYGGLQNTFTCKNVTFNLFFNFTKGYTLSRLGILNFTSPVGNIYNVPTYMLNRWQSEGQITDVQKFTTISQPFNSLSGMTAVNTSNGLYTNVFYARLQTVDLSYNLPEKLSRAVGLKTAAIYAQAQNLFSFTPFGGLNPDRLAYTRLAPLRTFIMGVQINL